MKESKLPVWSAQRVSIRMNEQNEHAGTREDTKPSRVMNKADQRIWSQNRNALLNSNTHPCKPEVWSSYQLGVGSDVTLQIKEYRSKTKYVQAIRIGRIWIWTVEHRKVR